MSALAEKLGVDASVSDDAYLNIRQKGQQRVMQFGFPDTKTEAWKYTSLRSMEKWQAGHQIGETASLPRYPIDATVLHFDHGQLVSPLEALPEGLVVAPLAPELLEAKDYDALYGQQAGAFAWLNLARFSQAWRIEVRGDHKLVIAITTSDEFDDEFFPRLRFDISPNAHLTLIEDHSDTGRGLVSGTSEFYLSEGANVAHVIRRRTHESVWIQRTDVEIQKDANYKVVTFDQGGRLTRHDLKVRLNEAGAHGEIDGLVVLNDKDHVDWHTEIVHKTGHTNSREGFRMLADGHSVGVFNGRIHIHEDADDSHSDLNTANLLLSDDARVNIKPELEIYSEEVTASHGATIGQLDERSMFYMQSRGLSEEAARALLKFGFAAEPLFAIDSESIRDWMMETLKGQL